MSASSSRVLANLKMRGLLEVLDRVCARRGFSRDELCGRLRTRALSRARHELWCLILDHPERYYSHNEIGRLVERDHTTVLAGIRAHRRHRGAETSTG